jgi:hypothetical protein
MAIGGFALGGTDHHAWQGEMIDRYIRWRNARAQPQTSFAPTQSSAPGPITRSTLLDGALAAQQVQQTVNAR